MCKRQRSSGYFGDSNWFVELQIHFILKNKLAHVPYLDVLLLYLMSILLLKTIPAVKLKFCLLNARCHALDNVRVLSIDVYSDDRL